MSPAASISCNYYLSSPAATGRLQSWGIYAVLEVIASGIIDYTSAAKHCTTTTFLRYCSISLKKVKVAHTRLPSVWFRI